MKPDTRAAMQNLIDQIRQVMPFELGEEALCSVSCNGCSLKLLEHIDIEMSDWERRLSAGDVPTFGDLKRLASTARKIHAVLERNGIATNPIPSQ